MSRLFRLILRVYFCDPSPKRGGVRAVVDRYGNRWVPQEPNRCNRWKNASWVSCCSLMQIGFAFGYGQGVRSSGEAFSISPPKRMRTNIGLKLTYIPPGSFTMGADSSEHWAVKLDHQFSMEAVSWTRNLAISWC